jgi:hypothetical protein
MVSVQRFLPTTSLNRLLTSDRLKAGIEKLMCYPYNSAFNDLKVRVIVAYIGISYSVRLKRKQNPLPLLKANYSHHIIASLKCIMKLLNVWGKT